MKRLITSVVTLACVCSFAVAGGDLKEVEPALVPSIPVIEENVRGPYLGLALTAVSARDSDVSMNFFSETSGQDRLGNVTFLLGYNFSEYIAVEGRYTTTFTQEDVVTMDNGWSIFAKPQYPINEKFSIYALLGYGDVKMSGYESGLVADFDDASGFQWGIGGNYKMSENFTLFLDYTFLANDIDTFYQYGGPYYNEPTQTDIDAITIGVNYLF